MKSNIYKKRTLTRIDKKIKLLGEDYNVLLFLNIRIIICILMLILFIICWDFGLIVGPIVSIVTYYLIEYFFFDIAINNREKKLEENAVRYFKIVLMSLKSGKDLPTSLVLACKSENSLLSVEFNKVLNDVEYGKSLNDALTDVKKRIPSDGINNVILSMIESKNNKQVLINSLDSQINHLQDKMIMDKKNKIRYIPIKIKVLTLVYFSISGFIVYLLMKGLKLI